MGFKKSMSSKKKGTHYFFRAEHCAEKSMGSKKSMSSKKQGAHTFFGPNIVPKKVWVPKKKELILLSTFLPVLFFLFELKISSNKKKVPGKTDFAGTFFCLN